MLRIIKKLIFILLIIFLIDVVFGKLFSVILYNSPDGRYYKLMYSLERSNEDILIIGSSQAETNLVPEIFEKKLNLSCWNSARGGQGIAFFRSIQEATLKRYTPKILILNFSGVFLERELVNERIGFMKPFYWKHPEIRQMIDKISIYEKYLVYSNLYLYNSSFYYLLRSYILRGLDGDIEKGGWKPKTGQIQIDPSINYEQEIFRESKPINEKAKNEFEILLSSFSKAGTIIYIITSPSFQPSSKVSSTVELNILIEKYNIKLFDYNTSTSFIYKPELFKDFDHLNVDGAKLISNKLADQIKQDMQYNSLVK